ncbi:hypothetical protein [Pelobacter seleniigenes]|uniref:hypothetical protein n=1 Tax=Pelobacter seleniigenes TaxID=407188 RepID=UPI0004A6CAD3|nr:hypothetical protein [Pelobacter seleniigenes]
MPNRANLSAEQKNHRLWPNFDPTELPVAKRDKFICNKANIAAYLDETDLPENIRKLPRQEIHSRLKRCLTLHSDGNIWGWRALEPGIRIKPYCRKKIVAPMGIGKKGGRAGALTALFERFPDIWETAKSSFLGKLEKDKKLKVREAISDIHQTMLRLCKQKLIDERIARGESTEEATQNYVLEYPFNTETRGLRSLQKRLNCLYDSHPQSAIRARHGADAARKYSAEQPKERDDESILRPYQRVELDAHSIDANFWLPEDPDLRFGGRENFIVRPWLLALIEAMSQAVLAYLIVISREVNHWDVLRVLKRALVPWQPMQLTVPGLRYDAGSGLPSGVIKGCEYAVWDSLLLDNALAHLAFDVRNAVKKVMNGTINDGPGRSPYRRPHVEGFFDNLEEHGFHRLPNTVGSGPNDPRRENAAEAAKTYQIGHQDLVELTDVLIANYNANSHRKPGGKSPLDILRLYTQTEHIRILEDQRKLIEFNPRFEVTIRSNRKEGRRPYVNLLYLRYSSHALIYSLSGKKAVMRPDPDGMHTSEIFLKDSGRNLGIVRVKDARWNYPHTIEQRKLYFNKGLVDIKNTSISDFCEGVKGRLTQKSSNRRIDTTIKTPNHNDNLKRSPDRRTFEL